MSAVVATGRVISNFALTHFNAATKFAVNVNEIEAAHTGRAFGNYFEEVSIYCSSCIISAAASLEALINEIFLSSNELQNKVNNFDSYFWGETKIVRKYIFFKITKKYSGLERKPALEKYRKALNLLNKPQIRKDEDVYKHAEALIGFRNYLIHFKPLWDDRRRNDTLETALEGLFETSPFVDAGADFLAMHCMSAGCADWAVNTARNFIQEFGRRSELLPAKIRSFR